jgi:serine protease SohB
MLDQVFADKSSIVGSIGVASIGFGFPELLEKLGVERRVRVAGEHKSRNDPFTPVRADDEAFTRRLLGQLHEHFKAHVMSTRGSKLQESSLEELFSGDVWLGEEAAALGLVDAIGDPRRVLRADFGDDVTLKPLSLRPQIPWPLSAIAPRQTSGGAASSAEVALPALLAAFEDRAAWEPYRLH